MLNLEKLSTEARNPASSRIDKLDTLSMMRVMNDEDQKTALAVKAILPDIARAVDVIAARLKTGGRLFYMGSGTSGRLGILDAVECAPHLQYRSGPCPRAHCRRQGSHFFGPVKGRKTLWIKGQTILFPMIFRQRTSWSGLPRQAARPTSLAAWKKPGAAALLSLVLPAPRNLISLALQILWLICLPGSGSRDGVRRA